MSRTVKILRPAERDLEQIREATILEYGDRAEVLFDRLERRILTLDQFADRGARPRDPALAGRGFRFIMEGPHVVFYKVMKSQVRIHRMLHGHRAYRHLL
jgi:plasmid stabilization system protein ParE